MARRKKTEDETNENLNQSNDSSDDTFGLPEIEYKPLDRVEETTVTQTHTVYSSTEEPEQQPVNEEYHEQASEQPADYPFEDETSPVWPKVLGILLVVLLAAAAGWYFVVYKPKADAEKARIEQEIKDREAKDRLARDAAALAEQNRLAAERRKADSLANVSKVGVFEALTERTGRYYVVIASAVDDDLLIDRAKKLAKEGVGTKLIPPFRKYKVYRLAIADGETYAVAQDIANTKKADYGEAVWVLKY